MLRRAVPGVPLSERYAAASDVERGHWLAVLAVLLARVHCLPLDEVRDLWQYPEDRVDAPADWATNFVQKKIASDLARITDALPEEVRGPFAHDITAWGQALAIAFVSLAPLHGDYYGDNVLVEDGSVTAILDWEAARLGDPLWDLARTGAAAFADAPDAFARFLAVYAERVPWVVDRDRIRRYRLLMAMGDLRYAVRHAPELISARVPVVIALWQQCRADESLRVKEGRTMILERFSRVTAAMATPAEAEEVLTFAARVLAPQKTRPLEPNGKERDLYHLTDWYLSGRNGIALARDKETGALAGMMAVQAFDAPYHIEHVANVFDFAAYYGYTAETAAVYRRTLIAEAYPRPQTLRTMVKAADAFARAQGYRYVYRHCHYNDLPVMLLWRRVGYEITEEHHDTGSVHMQKTL